MSINGNYSIPKTVVLVGLMGAGKTCIGKKMAQELDLPFVDADVEIEKAAGCSISEIFEEHGETYFRDRERMVIQRLLEAPVQILSTGGGAFMDEGTRKTILEKGISLWLRADLDILVERTSRRNHRPLLRNGNHREILSGLINQRHPIYAQADITTDSAEGSADITTKNALEGLFAYCKKMTD
ncbi:shikimate kinase [Kiloniella antarctica]|uniref:Shikimate kinase n=1 Tax=Kiloniella antarctica TaxID=1550907 RepID=A0ABW5BPZ5_9PROT